MDPRTVAERLGQVQVVDVRHPSEWAASHIEGARNIPEDEFDQRVDELDRSRPVITVCGAGSRSEEATGYLRSLGFEADTLEGGMLAWKWAGFPVAGRRNRPGPSGSAR